MGSKSALLRTLVAASGAKNGRFWSAQLCTEVARPTRFERVTLAFGAEGPGLQADERQAAPGAEGPKDLQSVLK
jgi:hypothetical protein